MAKSVLKLFADESNMKKTLRRLVAFVFALACLAVALAQTANIITGRVADPQGAGVAGFRAPRRTDVAGAVFSF